MTEEYLKGSARMLSPLMYTWTGVTNCCSASIISGINANDYYDTKGEGRAKYIEESLVNDALKGKASVDNIPSLWRKRGYNKPTSFVPTERTTDMLVVSTEHWSYCGVLEACLNRIHKVLNRRLAPLTGYPTYMISIYDTVTREHPRTVSCIGFIEWVQERIAEGHNIGSITVSGRAPGGHGGFCKAATFIPDGAGIIKYLKEELESGPCRVYDRLQELFRTKRPAQKITEGVHRLW